MKAGEGACRKEGVSAGGYPSEKSAQDFFKDFGKWSTHAPFMGRGLKKECDHNMQEKGP